jgi:hypothetical protein
VAAEGVALGIGDRQVQVQSLLREGANQGNNLEAIAENSCFVLSGQAEAGLLEATNGRQNAASGDGCLMGETLQTCFEVIAGGEAEDIGR